MIFGKRTHHDPAVVDEPGPSLARGPVLMIGTILLAFGLLGLLTNADFPRDQVTGGTVNGSSWLGIEVNGWTNFFAIAAGGLLLFGAAQHTLARMMALLVGLALGACAIISIIDGHDVLGLAAANTWTKVGFAASSIALLIAALMPRAGRRRTTTTYAAAERDRAHPVAAGAAGAGAGAVAAHRTGHPLDDRAMAPAAEERTTAMPPAAEERTTAMPSAPTAGGAQTADPAVRTGRFDRSSTIEPDGDHAASGGRMRRWLARH